MPLIWSLRSIKGLKKSVLLQRLIGKHDKSNRRDDVRTFRVPTGLATIDRPVSKCLIIGSCLAEGLPETLRQLPDGVESDYIIFNNAALLPKIPPSPIDSYDLIFLQIPLRSVIPDLSHARLSYDDLAGFEKLFSDARDRLLITLHAALTYSRDSESITAVTTLLAPQSSSLGRVMGRRDLRCFTYFVERLNEEIYSVVDSIPGGFVVNISEVISSYGSKYFQDDFLWQFNHAAAVGDNDAEKDVGRLQPVIPISEQMPIRSADITAAIWNETIAMFRSVKRLGEVKLVIFDLDDTLWRGVLAEQDEPDPFSIEGWPLGMAEAALYLKQRGIVIALASKNDESRVSAIWEDIWQGRLQLDDFAVRKINWNSKAQTVGEIIAEVNVLPDSVLFVDDNPLERKIVEETFPGIRVLGSNLYDNRRTLLWSAETQPAMITAESAQRNKMIQAQVKREELRGATIDRDAYLKSLNIRIEYTVIGSTDNPKCARAFELLNKTNQFNTTGKRWEAEELKREFAGGMEIVAFEVEDKFTNYGLVGMALVKEDEVIQFVMSCRVIGLDVELACLQHIKGDHETLKGLYVENEKNFLCSDLFARAGFVERDDAWIWAK